MRNVVCGGETSSIYLKTSLFPYCRIVLSQNWRLSRVITLVHNWSSLPTDPAIDVTSVRIISGSSSTNYKQPRRGDASPRDRDLISRTVDYSNIKFGARLNQTGESSPRCDKPRKKYGRKREPPSAIALFRFPLPFPCTSQDIPNPWRSSRSETSESIKVPRSPPRAPTPYFRLLSLPPVLPRPPPPSSLSQPVWALSLKVNLLKSSSSGLVLRSQT